MRVKERANWMSSPGFEILTFANEILYCCNRYRNEPLEADKNSLDWWSTRRWQDWQGSTCVCLAPAHTGLERALVDGVAPEQEEAEHVRGDFVPATILER